MYFWSRQEKPNTVGVEPNPAHFRRLTFTCEACTCKDHLMVLKLDTVDRVVIDRFIEQRNLNPVAPFHLPQLPKPFFLRSILLPGMAAEPENSAGNETSAEAETKAEVPSSPAAEAETEENDAAAEEDEEEEEEDEEEAEEEEAAEDESPPAEAAPTAQGGGVEVKKWPGWPGDNVFRLVVPVLKVGSIIGRKGELIKKLCEETKARVRILEGPIGVSDRIVSLSPLVLGFLLTMFSSCRSITFFCLASD